jgi:hypothetical protein
MAGAKSECEKMKQGMNGIQALAAEIARQHETKEDFRADTRTVEMRAGTTWQEVAEGETASPAKLSLAIGTEAPLPMTKTFHRQLGDRIGVPAKYYDRMREEAPELLAHNVNHWFRNEPKTRLIRTLDGKARAILSDRYQRVDHADVAEVALPVLADAGADVVSCEITERRMYIKAVNHKVRGDVTPGDTVEAGVIISNSEIGFGAVMVAPFINRLICLNGMVVNDARYRRHHVGAQTTEADAAYSILTDETLAADDKAVVLKVRDFVAGALEYTGFAPNLERMREAARSERAQQPAKAVETLAQRLTLTEGEQEGVLAHLITGGDLSRWGFVNAITRTAADAKDYDRATELEGAGGKVLDLAKGEWERLAIAA